MRTGVDADRVMCDDRATMTDGMRPSEVAERLGTSTRTVQRWILEGRLAARRVGGRWIVAFDAFDALEQATLGGRRGDARAGSLSPRSPRSPRAGHVIDAVFVANRGEIATRIARTCRRLGLRCVIPDADGPDALDLLDPDAVTNAVVASGADAVHPGFGFLAEHAGFAERVIAAGLTWIGPPPDAIRAMGDKAAARRLAAALGVPVPAGYDDPDQSDHVMVAAARAIGAPILVKPTAGGGGKGMRTVRSLEELPDAMAAARREARSAFGDDRLILERLVEGARHVEIQVLFDAHGRGVHLGERDCSLQRRHQKVLEEAPSPAIDAALRRNMGDAAVRLSAAVGYVGAGTCEFLVDDTGGFTFLEMNTRLQVEHPVTEAITGRDLVADQIRIAEGAPLGIDQPDVHHEGHAIEVRLYAEDAEAGFLPATGRIERLRWPGGPGVRVDAGVVEGDEVGARFDPMLAKIIAHGPNRAVALARLAEALDDTLVLGLTTNLRFLRWLVRQPVVGTGQARTDTLDAIWPPADGAVPAAIPDRAWVGAARELLAADDSWRGGFRLNATPTAWVESGGERRRVSVTRRATTPPDIARPSGSGVDHDPTQVRAGDVVHVDVDGRSVAFSLVPPPDVERAARAATAATPGGAVELVAPMPGQVRMIVAWPGTSVEAGDAVVVIEAMKMEHAVASPTAGRVAEVRVESGEQITRGAVLVIVEP